LLAHKPRQVLQALTILRGNSATTASSTALIASEADVLYLTPCLRIAV